jgi:hypothetical protein
MKRLSTKTFAGKLKIRTSRTSGSTGAILLFAFLLPLLAQSGRAAEALAGESANGPSATLTGPAPEGTLDGRAMLFNSSNPANPSGLEPAHPEEKRPYLRPAAGSGRAIPQVEYLPGPTIKDIGAV